VEEARHHCNSVFDRRVRRAGGHALITDDPAEFASDTVRLLSDADLYDTLSFNAYKLVSERYSWSDIGEQFEAMVQAVA